MLQLPARKLLVKARQYGVVLAVGVGLLQCVDLIEVTPDRGGQPHGFRLQGVRGLVALEDADLRRCEFRQLDVLRLKRLGNGAAGRQTHSFALFAPLDEVAPVRQRTPVALAVGLSGDRFQDPTIAGFELFEKNDVSHSCAIRISRFRGARERTVKRTARRLNYRKERRQREAGILPAELLPLNSHRNLNKKRHLSTRLNFASLRIPDSSTNYRLPHVSRRYSQKTRPVSA